MAYSQDQIERVIDDIDLASEPSSVTNVMVAAVLRFLSSRLTSLASSLSDISRQLSNAVASIWTVETNLLNLKEDYDKHVESSRKSLSSLDDRISSVGRTAAFADATANEANDRSKYNRREIEKLTDGKAEREELSNVLSRASAGGAEAVVPDISLLALRKNEQLLTEAERAQVLENLGRPEIKLFDMQWEAAGGTVIVSGVTYGLNGLNDITLAEALRIYSLFPLCESRMLNKPALFSNTRNVRTLFPVTLGSAGDYSSMNDCFRESREIEVLAIKGGHMVSNCFRAFYNCNKLRTIIGRIALVRPSVGEMFQSCLALEDVQILGLTCSISFSGSPRLSLASIEYIVRGASNTTAITITLHPTAYARVTDEMFAQALAKNITIAAA